MAIARALVLFFVVFFYTHHGINCNTTNSEMEKYSFKIDYDNNQFLLDGKPFRYVSGSFHYFRTPRQFWQDRLRKMKAAGLNAVSTYVEWSLHQPEVNQWNWQGDADLNHFIKLVQEEDMLLILRPGPYICAERDFGGFPYWLLNHVPSGKLRTNDKDYMKLVRIFFDNLFQRIEPHLRGNGGPIIMVQVENEYGSYNACDKAYMSKLAELLRSYVGDKALLYTTDGASYNWLRCGSTPGVYATVDFGTSYSVLNAFSVMRMFSPKGPLVNSEFYPGWLTHWNESLQTVSTERVVSTLTQMLATNASVNFYMFYGGTNFGFSAGANGGGPDTYLPQITSYDYDAPLTEAGDITPKYLAIREAISKFLPIPNMSLPENSPKGHYGPVHLKPVSHLLSANGRKSFEKKFVISPLPQTMESMNLSSYLVLYETEILHNKSHYSHFLKAKVADRALVYVNNNLAGVLSRSQKKYSLPLNIPHKAHLQILLENQGRLNFGNFINDTKGIYNVSVEDLKLGPWNCTGFQLQELSELKSNSDAEQYSGILYHGPMILQGYFNITNSPLDTYLDTTDWMKGVAYVNGHNLGRYWPAVGPQMTLYVPSTFLKQGINELVVLELEYVPFKSEMIFRNRPIFMPLDEKDSELHSH